MKPFRDIATDIEPLNLHILDCRLNDSEYLRSIGAAAISNIDKCLHPTAAGMLMFGDEYNIVDISLNIF